MLWHTFKLWHGHLARVISKYFMGEHANADACGT